MGCARRTMGTAQSSIFCAIALTVMLALGISRQAPAAGPSPATGVIAFDVLRNGRSMGTHRLDLHRDGDRLIVNIAIDLEVRLVVPIYRYIHRSREIWTDGRLVGIDTTTDDDGRTYRIAGRVVANGFDVESAAGRFVAPADLMPTSYWHERMIKGRPLFDTQEGKMIATEIVGPIDDVLIVEGRPVPVRVYDVSGDLKLRLWYGMDGRWLKLRFATRGSEIDYVLRQSHLSTALLDGER